MALLMQLCDALDSRGRRCQRRAVLRHNYHGDPEIYAHEDQPTWVRVALCLKHGGWLVKREAALALRREA